MFRFLLPFLLLLTSSGRLMSQILPREGRVLNYRIIGFSFPETGRKVVRYRLEIAAGNHQNADSFKANIIRDITGDQSRIIGEVPSFGCQYTWRVIYTHADSSLATSELHHFSTGMVPVVDSNVIRLRIIDSAVKYKDAFVFIDGAKTLYDMSGNPVWYFPGLKELTGDYTLRDMKITPFGTITLIVETRAIYEINYDGEVLWKGPNNGKVSGDPSENYHHEFTRLNNGNYMVLGYKDSIISIPGSRTASEPTSLGTIIEYNKSGKVVWCWKSAKYILGSDICNLQTRTPSNIYDLHSNSFFFDEQERSIYLSFRNVSRIIKIKYPEGNVVRTYGEIFKPGSWELGNGLFCTQHSARKSMSGDLYLFDDRCDMRYPPRVLKLQESATEPSGLKKTWEYECTLDGLNEKNRKPLWLVKGGNVVELPDSSILVCMGSQFSKVFIVGMDKRVVWSAVSEFWNAGYRKWDYQTQYRASLINDHKELEKLIWNSGPPAKPRSGTVGGKGTKPH